MANYGFFNDIDFTLPHSSGDKSCELQLETHIKENLKSMGASFENNYHTYNGIKFVVRTRKDDINSPSWTLDEDLEGYAYLCYFQKGEYKILYARREELNSCISKGKISLAMLRNDDTKELYDFIYKCSCREGSDEKESARKIAETIIEKINQLVS